MKRQNSDKDDGNIGQLEAEALKRKERLNSLKRKVTETPEIEAEENVEDKKLPKPQFRSYRPQDDTLRENVRPEPDMLDVNEAIQAQLASAKSQIDVEELDISNLAPRKPDWDLKRDCAKKFEILEQKTKKAIAEIIRERLKETMSGAGNDSDSEQTETS